MNDLSLWWLMPVLFQAIGASIALMVFGFAYESAVKEALPFIRALQVRSRSIWLAVAGVVFIIGMDLSQTRGLGKMIAGVLLVVIIGYTCIVWVVKSASHMRKSIQAISFRSVGIFVIKLWLSTLLVLIMLWGIHLGWHTYHLYGLARKLQTEGIPSQVEDLVLLINSAAEDVSGIEEYLHPFFPVFNSLKGIPVVGPYLGQIDPLLTYADGLARAGEDVSVSLEPLLSKSKTEGDSLSLTEHASQVLQAGQVRYARASEALEQARAARSRIIPELLPESVRYLFTILDDRFDTLVAGVQFLQVVPGLLGAEQSQNYLVLAQNRDELRATGGFISGIGSVIFQAGKIEGFSMRDSYAVDDFSKPYPVPPEALRRYMLADYWVTRDANWSPDFPTAARQIQALYTLSTGIQIQGVIAFNQLALKGILEAIGAVQVPGTDEPVTSTNVENYMHQAWAPEPEEGLSQEWWLHRKDFMQLLGNTILEKILVSTEPGQLLNLSKVIVRLLDQGQVLVYFDDPSAQKALAESGWDGALHPGAADYLYLVDSNIGFNKVDAVIKRSLQYQVDFSDINHPVGRVTLTYQHSGIGNTACTQVANYGTGTYQDLIERCYWDYWRVYTPGGSELLSSTVLPVASDALLNGEGWSGQVEKLPGEANTQIFAGILVLPIGKSSQFDISYALPSSIIEPSDDGQISYSLQVQLQPGLEGLPYRFEINLPLSFQISTASEGITPVGASTWVWQGVLETSAEFRFVLSPYP